MSGYYPAGVTGSEEQIIGTGTEDKCDRCLANADEETTLQGIPDGIYETEGELLCQECFDKLFGEVEGEE